MNIGDILYFIENKGNGLVKAKATVSDVFNSEQMIKDESLGGSPGVDDFPGIFDYYARYKNDSNEDWSHHMMTEHYVDVMAEALREYDPSCSSEVYYALAWSGLMSTVA